MGLNWSLNEDVMVIHRMAVDLSSRRIGIGMEITSFAGELS
jgi:hypothetical protein